MARVRRPRLPVAAPLSTDARTPHGRRQVTVAARARRAVNRPVRTVLGRLGYELVPKGPAPVALPPDCDEFTASVVERVRPYTLTSVERIMGLVEAVRYVVAAEVPGDIVECGVWRGGSMMVVALTLVDLGAADRDIYLFDTFTRTPDPGEEDVDIYGVRAVDIIGELRTAEGFRYLPMAEVEQLLRDTGYPAERLRFVPGLVEDTIPGDAPERIALCRLDTDWYASTAHELEHLWPRISERGVLLVDDYGEFMGARKAVDEYLANHGERVLLHRMDCTGRLVLKPEHAGGHA